MPVRYAVDLLRAAFFAGTPAYGQAVSEGPLLDLVVVSGLFVILIIAGALVFNHRERNR